MIVSPEHSDDQLPVFTDHQAKIHEERVPDEGADEDAENDFRGAHLDDSCDDPDKCAYGRQEAVEDDDADTVFLEQVLGHFDLGLVEIACFKPQEEFSALHIRDPVNQQTARRTADKHCTISGPDIDHTAPAQIRTKHNQRIPGNGWNDILQKRAHEQKEVDPFRRLRIQVSEEPVPQLAEILHQAVGSILNFKSSILI